MKTYGVEDLAKQAGIEVASARVMLRKVGHKKKGRNYEFSGKDEMAKIIEKSRAGGAKKTDKKKAPAKKVAKKAPAKKAAKKAAPKKEESKSEE